MAGENDEEYETGLPDGDDDLSSTLREQLAKMKDGEDDDHEGFAAPLDEDDAPSKDRVSEEDGTRRLADHRDGKRVADPDDEDGKAKDQPTPPGGKPAPAADTTEGKKPEDAPADPEAETGKPADVPAATDEEYNAAVSALPPAIQARLTQQQTAYGEMMKPFQGREALLQERGVTAAQATEWLVNVEDYARRDTPGYLAWAVNEFTGKDPAKTEEVLAAAAKKLGFTVSRDVPAESDDDLFMTDREKELLAENNRLKAAQQPAEDFGPDSAAERQRRDVMTVISELGPDNQPVRPHFNLLMPAISGLIQQKVAATGQPATMDDVKEAYEAAELANPQTRDAARARILAAQTPPPVQQPSGQAKAASAQRAENASKIIDGGGQGSSRPAQADADLPLEDLIRMQLRKTQK